MKNRFTLGWPADLDPGGVLSGVTIIEVPGAFTNAKGERDLEGAVQRDDLFQKSTLERRLGADFSVSLRRGLPLGGELYSVSYSGIKIDRLSGPSKSAGSTQFQTPSAFNFECAPPNLNPPPNPDLVCHPSGVPG